MKNTLAILLAFAISTSCSPKRDLADSSGKPHELRPEMAMEKLPDTRFLYLPVTGDYSRHPEVIQKLSVFLEKAGIPGKNCTGIYPEDPDAVPVEKLDWEIGFEVPEDTPSPETGEFEMRTLEGATALVVQSSVQNSAAHGIYCKIWLLEHGYVQTQPTRMVYHMDSVVPEEQSTTIIFPVVKRTRDIPVITGCTSGHNL